MTLSWTKLLVFEISLWVVLQLNWNRRLSYPYGSVIHQFSGNFAHIVSGRWFRSLPMEATPHPARNPGQSIPANYELLPRCGLDDQSTLQCGSPPSLPCYRGNVVQST